MADKIEALEAEQGERMIEVKVRFWTNDLTEEEPAPRGKGKIRPKHAWAAGVVRIGRNPSHGIVPRKPVPFNSLLELSTAIERVLIDHGIKIHRSRKMRRYTPRNEVEAGRRERLLRQAKR